MDTFPADAMTPTIHAAPGPGYAARRAWWYTFVSRPPGQSHNCRVRQRLLAPPVPAAAPASGCSGAGSHVGGAPV